MKIQDLFQSSRINEIELAAIEMEWAGFAIDVPYFNAQAAKAATDQVACLGGLSSALESLGVSSEYPDDIWSSPKQLGELLHGRLGLPKSPYWAKGRVKIDDGEIKLDRTALEWVASRCVGPHLPARRVVEGVMELRRIGASLKYLEKLPRYVAPDGFVHPVCGPAGDEDDRSGAATGRFGMKNPEAQQIPRDPKKDLYGIRRGFIAPPGDLLAVVDYHALEVVILANFCNWLFNDDLLLALTAPGEDIHSYSAHKVFGQVLKWVTPGGRRLEDQDPKSFKTDPELSWYRDAVKAVFYGLAYGKSSYGFSTSLRGANGEPVGSERAEEIVAGLYEALPGIQKWQGFCADVLRRDKGISSIDGRYADFSDLIAKDDPNSRRQWAFDAACRKAYNYPLQATGAFIIGCAMADMSQSSELAALGGIVQLQIHDEIQLRAPAGNIDKVLGLAKEIMAGAYPLENLRSSGGVGANWMEAK